MSEEKSISKQVDEIINEKEKSKSFKDSEQRVGGSKKEKQAYKDLINSKDLEDIEKDAVLAKELVKKDKVWPKLIIANEIDKGVSGGTAFLKYTLRNACGAYPPNNAQKRKFYVGFIEYIISRISPIVSMSEIKTELKNIYDNTILKAIEILQPELKDNIEEQRGEILELQAKENELRETRAKAVNKLREKYGHYWTRENISDEDKSILSNYDYTDEKITKLSAYQRYNLLPVEKQFSESIGFGDSSLSILRFDILKEVFGKRLAKFLHNQGADYIEEAEKYNALNQIQSKELIEVQSRPTNDAIRKIEHFIQYFGEEKHTHKERVAEYDRLSDAYERPSLQRWHKQFFGVSRPTYLGYYDVKNDPYNFEIWLQKNVGYLKNELARLKTKLREISEKYKVRDNDYSWAEKTKNKKGERTELVANSGIPLSYIKRTGGVEVLADDLDTDEKIKQFYPNVLGITRFEYGNYLPDAERAQHAKHFAGAMLDLSEMLNWDVKALTNFSSISLEKGADPPKAGGGINLGIKFASSGHGRAMAHYESGRVAINLTRGAGDGTVAHEMAHYIDNMLTVKWPVDTPVTLPRRSVYASYFEQAYYQYDWKENVSNDEVMRAVRNVMLFIYNGTINLAGENSGKIEELKKLHLDYLKEKDIKYTVKKNAFVPVAKMPEKIEEWIEKNQGYFNGFPPSRRSEKYLGHVVNYYGEDSYEFTFHIKDTTAYYAYCRNIKSEYWSFAWELFARAFECYIFDKLAKENRANNYLVSGAQFAYEENIYPQAIEREILFILFEELFKTIKAEAQIPNFSAFRETRSDEYTAIDIPRNSVLHGGEHSGNVDSEETESLTVNADTGEVQEAINSEKTEEINYLTISEKIKHLHEKLRQHADNKLYAMGGTFGNVDNYRELNNHVFDKLIIFTGC